MADTISVSIIITFAAELLFSLVLPILALVVKAHRLRLDCYTALALKIHIIEHLRLHFTL